MKRFEFRLQRVLEWRDKRLEIEREKQRMLIAELAAIDSSIREHEEARNAPYDGVMTGLDLAALQQFRDRLERELVQLAQRRHECSIRVAQQNEAVVVAHRDVRLLERLRENMLQRWQRAADLELDQIASETFLAQFTRRRV